MYLDDHHDPSESTSPLHTPKPARGGTGGAKKEPPRAKNRVLRPVTASGYTADVPETTGGELTGARPSHEATQYLARLEAGDAAAADMLLPLVYDQLRGLAGAIFQGQPADHTLQPTALVHEAYLKLIGSPSGWKDSAHFCAVAATAMRQILSNHARDKRAAKRRAHRVDLSVDQMPTPTGASALDLLELDEALTELAERNSRHARMVELRFFGGLTVETMADILGISTGMARREWRAARAWLSCRLSTGEAP